MRTLVPLIEHLTNGQFGQTLDRLVGLGEPATEQDPAVRCRCGCGQPVAEPRKFASQIHYNDYLSRTRYIGRHLVPGPKLGASGHPTRRASESSGTR